jgi:hypothetical protein
MWIKYLERAFRWRLGVDAVVDGARDWGKPAVPNFIGTADPVNKSIF